MSDAALDIPTSRMTEEEFVAWDAARTDTTRVEFHEGFIVTMQSEALRHSFAKHSISTQFANQLGFNGPCYSIPDGMRVRTPDGHRFEPDAMIRCGKPPGGGVTFLEDPVVVVEVFSPSNSHIALTTKQERYFSCPTLSHVLLVDPLARTFQDTVRGPAPDKYLTTVMRGGTLTLDPPGVKLDLDAVLAAIDAA